jgi:hypothetical protein
MIFFIFDEKLRIFTRSVLGVRQYLADSPNRENSELKSEPLKIKSSNLETLIRYLR